MKFNHSFLQLVFAEGLKIPKIDLDAQDKANVNCQSLLTDNKHVHTQKQPDNWLYRVRREPDANKASVTSVC